MSIYARTLDDGSRHITCSKVLAVGNLKNVGASELINRMTRYKNSPDLPSDIITVQPAASLKDTLETIYIGAEKYKTSRDGSVVILRASKLNFPLQSFMKCLRARAGQESKTEASVGYTISGKYRLTSSDTVDVSCMYCKCA